MAAVAMAESSAGARTLGVPPPKYSVVKVFPDHAGRADRSSAIRASTMAFRSLRRVVK